ncbi:DUF7619 domain-containing protein [Flavobacterium sp. 25HG05S-40]|uniref:DUF7619 domain-containing protein n=1 Tax=Flavobacterium sp. 25HG05S-40 TaxID=3458682 RepID=UPI004044D7B0
MKNILFLSLAFLLGLPSVVHSQVCGGTFTDPAGATANYANNSDYTVTISPSNPGDRVTVTFTAFNTEAQFDALYVFNGSTITAPQIASTNTAGFVPGGLAGGFWGNTIPGPITSTSVDGALTFRFRSDSSGTNLGWVANVTCAPVPSCTSPVGLSTSAVTFNSATLNWMQPMNPNASFATAWECLVLPAGSPAPNAFTTGFESATTNPFIYNGLASNTCYAFYVRAVCSETDKSEWVGGFNFCTAIAPPVCGGQFLDNGGASANYASNSDVTTTICPTNPGEAVSVSFNTFSTEANYDALYVFDGNSTAAPQIMSSNPPGNVIGGLAGGFWGTTIPGPFTSSSTDGCLTFRFRSDASVQNAGWVANIVCVPAPSCSRPVNVTVNSITSNSAVIGWTDTNTVSSWEIIPIPFGSAPPSSTASGQTVTTNPAVVTGLTSGTRYSFYVRAICNAGDTSSWSQSVDGTTFIANDECSTAIVVPISGRNCSQPTAGSLTGATASSNVLDPSCIGAADDDAWFTFVATKSTHLVSFANTIGTTFELNFAIYSGTCSALTPFYCSVAGSISGLVNNLTVGSTYYLRVYSNAATPQTVSFGVCISTPSNCSESESICGVNNYINSTEVQSLGTIGCLFTSPNATYFKLKIASTGPVNLLLTQSEIGSTLPNLDVDYAAWGPFTSPTDACNVISSGQAPGIGVPVTTTTGCSYSAAPTEILEIANAQAGEYYIILITNFSNRVGYINVSQSNANEAGAGSIDCSGIRLNAFIDSNSNGTQENDEANFPLGQFHYEVNNDGNPHAIVAPSGTYVIYDDIVSNLYSLSYTVNSDYNSLYNTPTGYTNVSVSSGGLATYNFPLTVLQNYTDLGITLVPQGSPRAGSTYSVKLVYTNNGNQTLATGTVTFSNTAGTTITSISQTGTNPTTNGFTYDFSNLLPFESRIILITIEVPPIPTVFLGQLLTNSASVIPPSGDIVATNNISSSTQAIVASYDPNDKVEGHGEKILFSSFTANDYLEYTIRFENNGTASALDIRINDVLDSQLDANTIEMLAASHNYFLDRVDNNLVWKFTNIQLPVSIPDTDTGKGFIKFKVKPKPGYAVGDIIPNTAEIYFDTNPAIVTNTFNTEFVSALGNDLFTENSIMIYPNPANSNVFIALQNSTEIIENIAIYDVLGKTINQVLNLDSNESAIDVSQLSKGIYLIEVTTQNNLKQIKKLIVQ